MNFIKALGNNPSGGELEKLKRSSNYKNGVFHNLRQTDMMSKEASMPKTIWRFLNKPADAFPPKPLPSVKTDLKSLSSAAPVIVWFGHSSYLIHVNGINILVDPIFSGHASPFNFNVKSFPGSDVYHAVDMPDIDILLITHDHYDHLDYETILALKPKIRSICTSLGVSSHLEFWGIDKRIIHELDWWQKVTINGVDMTALPARHFSGRTLARFKTLWSSFVIDTGTYKLYVGADSGADPVFKTIGEKYGPIDMAILESGQYNIAWPDIHMMPEQTVQASIDLGAKVLMPVHWGKFALGLHPWDEPIRRLMTKALELNVRVTTPMIGEPVIIDHSYPDSKWWLTI